MNDEQLQATPLLRAQNLSVAFGSVIALENVSFHLNAGETVGLIGPNGAGKTTFIDAITGFVTATGQIAVDGHAITRASVHQRVKHGISRTFQSMELFQDLTVEQNLQVAADNGYALGSRRDRREIVQRSLETFGLSDSADVLPETLPLGRQKLVAVARALASGARVILLDEPAAGLDSDESAQFAEHLRAATTAGVGILIIDHDMDFIMNACSRLLVLSFGKIIAEGTPTEISANALVRAAYLGIDESDGTGP